MSAQPTDYLALLGPYLLSAPLALEPRPFPEGPVVGPTAGPLEAPCVACGRPVPEPADLFCGSCWIDRCRRTPRLCDHRLAFYDREAQSFRCGACERPVVRQAGKFVIAENASDEGGA